MAADRITSCPSLDSFACNLWHVAILCTYEFGVHHEPVDGRVGIGLVRCLLMPAAFGSQCQSVGEVDVDVRSTRVIVTQRYPVLS